MRASPACQVSLRRFGAWRAAIVALTLLAALAMAAWMVQAPAPVSSDLMTTFAGLATVACVLLAASLWRVPPASLRWDGQCWHLDATPGTLNVQIDVGLWMLLRFTPEGGGRDRWLPVQRAGLEAQWHALRCAVYSPAQGPGPGRTPS